MECFWTRGKGKDLVHNIKLPSPPTTTTNKFTWGHKLFLVGASGGGGVSCVCVCVGGGGGGGGGVWTSEKSII